MSRKLASRARSSANLPSSSSTDFGHPAKPRTPCQFPAVSGVGLLGGRKRSNASSASWPRVGISESIQHAAEILADSGKRSFCIFPGAWQIQELLWLLEEQTRMLPQPRASLPRRMPGVAQGHSRPASPPAGQTRSRYISRSIRTQKDRSLRARRLAIGRVRCSRNLNAIGPSPPPPPSRRALWQGKLWS